MSTWCAWPVLRSCIEASLSTLPLWNTQVTCRGVKRVLVNNDAVAECPSATSFQTVPTSRRYDEDVLFDGVCYDYAPKLSFDLWTARHYVLLRKSMCSFLRRLQTRKDTVCFYFLPYSSDSGMSWRFSGVRIPYLKARIQIWTAFRLFESLYVACNTRFTQV
jgi:hypothetical protein